MTYISSLLIAISVTLAVSGCSQSQMRKESMEGDIQQNWNPEKVGELTREQAFKGCNNKAKAFGADRQTELNSWDTFMLTCMRNQGFDRENRKPIT